MEKIARARFGRGPLLGESGNAMLVLSVTGFDPQQTLGDRKAQSLYCAVAPDKPTSPTPALIQRTFRPMTHAEARIKMAEKSD
jgi:hypothetical protein